MWRQVEDAGPPWGSEDRVENGCPKLLTLDRALSQASLQLPSATQLGRAALASAPRLPAVPSSSWLGDAQHWPGGAHATS